MGEPRQLQSDIKLTPGNRTVKGRRSAPKAEGRVTGKPEPYAYTFKDPRVAIELPVLNSANGWWAEPVVGPIRVQKLVDAYCFYYTDEEACSYAGITKDQLKYFQEIHPDFYTIKSVAKSQPDMHAKKKLVEAAQKDENWAAWWLSRTQKETFSTRIETAGANGRDLVEGLTQHVRQMGEGLRAQLKRNDTSDQKHIGESPAGDADAGQDGAGHAPAPAPAGSGGEAVPA